MKKIVRLTESDLSRIVRRVINESETDLEYDSAVNFCGNMESWWEGSSNLVFDPEPKKFKLQNKSYKEFFKKYQRFWDDEDNAAAMAFENAAIQQLKMDVTPGNRFYSKIKTWIEEISDEISDSFQSECYINLVSKDGRSQDFMVDPEIDV
jgi:hypothetical protein